ncbi:MAG: hypothetical protein LBR15_00915 [Methanobrevibacter sp.]|nr:hypothetical protein [Candidatus Methanovirga australis]
MNTRTKIEYESYNGPFPLTEFCLRGMTKKELISYTFTAHHHYDKLKIENLTLKEKKEDEIMNFNPTEKIIKELQPAEKKYRTLNQDLKFKKIDLILNLDWNMINDERLENNLTKITNQVQRDGYIDNLLKEDYSEVLEAELKYNHLRRLYETIEQVIQGKVRI